jgi:hypothetical protein
MKSISLLIIVLVSISSIVGCATWSTGDKVAAGYMIAGKVADFYTTERNHDNHRTWKAHERNPILGDDPSDTQLAIYFPISTLATLVIAHYIPEWRKVILYSMGTTNFYFAYKNNELYHKWEDR